MAGDSFAFTVVADCNDNGVPDDTDIAEGTSQDCQPNDIPDECDIAENTSADINDNDIPDECECYCGDIDRSGGAVDLDDYATFVTCYGLEAPGGDCDWREFICSDLDMDDEVDANDYATFALIFGLECTQLPPNCEECAE